MGASPVFRGPRRSEIVGVTLAEYDVDSTNGCTPGDERNPIPISAAAICYGAPAELLYQVATVNVTYGLTDDLDINYALPIAALDFGMSP